MNKLIINNCKECGSDIIIVSNGYHTCKGCGFVSEGLILEEQTFYSLENKTGSYCKSRTIGNHLERIRLQYTSRMNSMIKLDCHKTKHQILSILYFKFLKRSNLSSTI